MKSNYMFTSFDYIIERDGLKLFNKLEQNPSYNSKLTISSRICSHYHQRLPLRSIASLRSALSLYRGLVFNNANGTPTRAQACSVQGLRSSLRLFFGRDLAPYWLTPDDKPKNNDSARLSRFAFRFFLRAKGLSEG
jgi:hypothetical protein